MDPVARAIWFVESHLDQELTLDEIAAAATLSKFHLSRAFGEATRTSLMRYVRGRRLTEAARALREGAPDILAVALQAGYGSHEAFTRAFREQFGTTPDAVRAQQHLDGIALVEAFRRNTDMNVTLEEPRVERGPLLLLAGFAERFTFENVQRIPLLWQRFGPHVGHVPGEVGAHAYGVRYNADDGGFDYLAAVEVSTLDALPPEFQHLRVPEQTYAVFAHRDHVSTIRATMHAIWSSWLPQSGRHVVDAPDFERYGPDFDTIAGTGTIEMWIPIEA